MTMSARQIRLLMFTVLLLLLAMQSPAWAQGENQKSSAWSDTDCSTFKIKNVPASRGVECGFVTVPLRHKNPDGPKIQLGTVVIPSRSPDRKPDPLFMAQGGPGGSTIDTYASYLLTTPEDSPTPDRDLVLWDQRGTLYSKPKLMCPEVSEANAKAATAGKSTAEGDVVSAYKACGDRLENEVNDLSAFNSAENADDVESVRAALGYENFNFYGVSYGTELGQFVMRSQPEHLRSVVLDGVVPLDYNIFTEPAFAQQRIGERYFGACAKDPRCNEAFPNLTKRYSALIDRLNKAPIRLTVSSLDNPNKKIQVEMNGELLESSLYEALYLHDIEDLVPLIIDQTEKGNYTFLQDTLLPLSLFDDTEAEGMHYTVACADWGDSNPDSVDYSDLFPRLAKEAPEDARSELGICKEWDIEVLPRTDFEPVRSDIPVLLLSGAYDPITPPEYARELLPNLPNGQHVIFSLGSHGQAVSSACANRIIGGFLDAPDTEVDGSCAREEVPPFKTDSDIIFLPPIRDALSGYGLSGIFFTMFETLPGLLGTLLLLTSIPVFVIAWLVVRLRHRDRPEGRRGWTRTMSRLAPWLAVLAAPVLVVFIVGLAAAIFLTVSGDQILFSLGAIDGSWRWLFFLPLLGVLLVLLMAASAVALWAGRQRSVAMRVYYSLLVLAGVGTIISLFALGVMGVAFG